MTEYDWLVGKRGELFTQYGVRHDFVAADVEPPRIVLYCTNPGEAWVRLLVSEGYHGAAVVAREGCVCAEKLRAQRQGRARETARPEWAKE